MATRKWVNLKVAPYVNNIKLTSSNKSSKSGKIAWMDKEYADKLLALAKSEKADIWVESGMRSPYQNEVNKYGSSHSTGRSADLAAVVKKEGGVSQPYPTSREARQNSVINFIAKTSHGEDPLLRSGATAIPGSDNGKLTITNIDNKKVATKDSRVVNMSYNGHEAWHVEDRTYRPDRKGGGEAAVAETFQNLSSFDQAGTFTDNGSLDNPPAEALMEIDARGFPVAGATLEITRINDYANKTVTAAPITITDKNVIEDINIETSQVDVVGGPKWDSGGGVNVGHGGDTNDSKNARTGYTDDPNAVYLNKTNYILPNDSRAITADDLSIGASMEDKRIKNAIGCRNPFGTLEKYRDAEQPAALRLVLDKLFENERDKTAIAKWAAFEEAKVTYIDQFIMERVSTQSKENYRVVSSLGEEYKVYFGTASPEVLTVTGYTLNTQNQQWLYDFRYFYENYLKGSRLVENRLRAFLTFTDSIFEVLPVSFSYSESAKIPGAVTMSMDCIVLQWTPFGEYTNPITRGKTKTTAKTPIHSPAQLDMSDLVRGMLVKVNEGLSEGAGYIGLKEGYTRAIDQILLQKARNGKHRVPMYIAEGGKNEEIQLQSTTTASGVTGASDTGAGVSSAATTTSTNFPSIYAKEAATVANAGVSSTTSSTPGEVVDGRRTDTVENANTKAAIAQTVVNNQEKKGGTT